MSNRIDWVEGKSTGAFTPSHCCDPRLVVVPWPVIGCPKAGRRTLDDPSASANHPMTGHRTAQTSDRRLSTLTNQIWFPAEDWLPPKNCLWKRTFRNLNNVMYEIWFCGYRWLLLHNDFSILKSIMGEIIENFRRIGSGRNGVATHFNRRIFSWHFKQTLLFRLFPQTFICVELNILTRCIHTRYGCFISLQMVVKIQCFVTSHRSQDGIMKNHTG